MLLDALCGMDEAVRHAGGSPLPLPFARSAADGRHSHRKRSSGQRPEAATTTWLRKKFLGAWTYLTPRKPSVTKRNLSVGLSFRFQGAGAP